MLRISEEVTVQTERTMRAIGAAGLIALLLAAESITAAPAQRLDPRFEVGEPFPDFAFPSLEDGTPTTISDFRGKKLLLHVFASW